MLQWECKEDIMSATTQIVYSGEPQQVLRTCEQYTVDGRVPAGTRVRLKDLTFNGCEPVYICHGLRYAVRRGTCGWETTGTVLA